MGPSRAPEETFHIKLSSISSSAELQNLGSTCLSELCREPESLELSSAALELRSVREQSGR